MKSKHRHELQHNVLDTELGKLVEFLKAKGTYVLWALVLVAAVVVIAWYAYGRHQTTYADLQSQYDRLVRLQDDPTSSEQVLAGFRELAGQDTDKRVAADCCVRAGSVRARQALVSASQTERDELLGEAADYYRQTIQRYGDQHLAVAKAHLGLGKLAESRQDFATARMEYDAILTMGEVRGYPIVALAMQSLQNLGDLEQPVSMATTAPATQPATEPADETAAE